MIDVSYNEAMIAKARAISEEARSLPRDQRDAYCQDRCGLTFAYLRRVGKQFKKPSARVLMNLGYELLVRDLATGELSRLELNVPCDWNPRNPRMNPVSTPVYLRGQEPISSTSE